MNFSIKGYYTLYMKNMRFTSIVHVLALCALSLKACVLKCA